MSVSSIDSKIAPRSGRFSDTRITPADVFQMVAWAALTAVLFGYAIADGSIGALVLGALVLTQVWGAWSSAASRQANDVRDKLAPQEL
jgi:cytochrome b